MEFYLKSVAAEMEEESSKKLKLVGYWVNLSDEASYLKYPDPNKLQGINYDGSTLKNLLEYLKGNPTVTYFRGHSKCRICGESCGSTELSDGIWIWPEGLAHYVEQHLVALPKEFVEDALKKPLCTDATKRVGRNEEFWINWGAQYRLPTSHFQQNHSFRIERRVNPETGRVEAVPVNFNGISIGSSIKNNVITNMASSIADVFDEEFFRRLGEDIQDGRMPL